MHIAEAETEEKKTGCYRHTEMQRDLIIETEGEGAPHHQTEKDSSGHYPGGRVLLL